jgi:hypothetical protein
MPHTPDESEPNQPIKIEGLPSVPTDSDLEAALKAAGIAGVKFTPLQLLAFLLKLVLKDRITNAEITTITETHRDLIKEYWGDHKE